MKKLIIVESPLKVKTILEILEKLGRKDFSIIGTAGHICNLEEKQIGVTLEENGKFKAKFKPMSSKKNIIENIKKQLPYVDEVYMCTDDDREGERIAEDVVHFCGIKKYFRVTFTELTKTAIKKALIDKEGIRLIDEKIVLAQWTRRIIDRIIGYGLSFPLTEYFKINNKLTYIDENGDTKSFEPRGTGRIIALSLHAICKRQKEIDAYNEVGSTITDVVIANYKYDDIGFMATGNKLNFKKEEEDKRNETIRKANLKIHRVYSRTNDVVPESPPHALTTLDKLTASSLLYQISPKETSKIAKDLYESGFINYPRTDSVNLSETASQRIIEYLLGTLGEESSENEESLEYGKKEDVLMTKRRYKEKTGNAQNAHEAIRPSIFSDESVTIDEIKKYSPENIKDLWSGKPNFKHFGNFHFLIYQLIWIRSISTQFKDSEYDVSKISVKAGDYTFDAKSNDRIYDGWEKYNGNLILNSTAGSKGEDWRRKRVVIPSELAINKIIEDAEVTYYESPSKAPKRISESALMNILSNLNVARPSTLHTFSSALEEKKYIKSLNTILVPTELGMEVNNVTESRLEWLIDEKRAKEFEKTIEKIEKGKIKNVHELIREYWDLVNKFRAEINYELL